ncbi:MAG: HAMP domain-containing protein [Ignavibacteriae bacterium]|nr:HAMP domain-containing protein [Ignavibacteriota bacterium]
MIRAIRERLEYKILLLLTAVLLIGFGSYVIVSIQKESEQMVKDHREKLWLYSETIMAGIRNVMLTGKSPYAAELVNDVRQNLNSFGDLTIYDRLGREVFLREGEGVIYNVHETDTLLSQTLSAHATHWTMGNTAGEDILTRYEPLPNRVECWRCHDPKDHIRGVLQLALKPSAMRTGSTEETVQQTAGIMGDFIATAFRNIMVGGGGEFMDTLMLASKNIPAVKQVRVFSRLGDIAFGDYEDEVDAEPILEIIENRTKEKQFKRNGKTLSLLLPLANEERCQICHGEKFPMRGVLAVDFDADSLRMFSSDVAKKLTPVFQTALFEGFRGIMLVGRAGSARYYLDEIRSLPVIQKLSVYDKDGNERFLNPTPRQRIETKLVADSVATMEFVAREGDDDRLVMLTPLRNEQRCYSCHGRNHKVRGVVEISASMGDINEAINANKVRSTAVGIVTIFFVWGVLRIFMNSVVVKPVKAIEGVALRIGEGDFSAHAEENSSDEIGNLARRINEMTKGLRERLHLQKFVSRQTADAVSRADLQGVRLGGERKVATVFFSDIRGFTAFSEDVEPEKVVTMLNTTLSRQSSIVKKYGGDIDKYVGDELVAVFEGGKMVENALRAALEIQEELSNDALSDGKERIAIGIGINTGEMVMGAMGSEERMDYTVIGDNVNLGARLCSAAKGGQILMSDFALKHLGSPKEFKLVALDPIKVKGKAKPIKIYEVQKRKVKA